MLDNNEKVIVLENVSVRYRAPETPIGTFKEFVIRFIQGKVRYKEFLALNHIDLQIKQGEIFGIIGRNGAGKSTLLKVISRVLIPKEGRIWVKGRISPLLGLGAGFHPELTGLENIYLKGTLLGHSRRDIDEHIEDIVDFSGLGKFINAPLRSYSSGMSARLGFAVTTTWEPEIFLLDEVLAVGDEIFRRKCKTRLDGFRNNKGTTTLMVSHQMDTISSMCDRAAWIDNGSIREIGVADNIIDAYLRAQQ